MATEPGPPLGSRLRPLLRPRGRFRALHHRDFRRYFIGHAVSANGTWMQSAAQAWLLYRLTDQPLWLGGLAACRFGPSLLLSPFAGVLADRHERRRLVLATQSAAMVLAAMLAVLTLAGWITPTLLLILALCEGLIFTVDVPARQVLQVDLVGPEDLPSAVGMSSGAFNLARMLGPAAAGVVVSAVGEGWCFAANAVSFLAVLIALAGVRTPARPAGAPAPLFRQIGEALAYVRGDRRVAAVMVSVLVTSLMGLGYSSILPVIARDVLGGDARTYGWLLAAAGLGAVVGALRAAGRTSPRGTGRVLSHAQILLGLSLLGLAAGRSVAVDVAALALAGFALASQLATGNAFIQVTSPPALRGRVLALYVWLFVGSAPASGLLFGILAERFGAPAAVLVGGIVCTLAGTAFRLLLPRLRTPR